MRTAIAAAVLAVAFCAFAAASVDSFTDRLPSPQELKAISSLRGGVEAYDRGDLKTAARVFENYLIKYPSDAMVMYMLGATYLEMKQYIPAESILKQAVKLQPKKADIRLGLAKTYIMQDKLAEALPELERYVKLKPGDKSALKPLGTVYYSLGKTDKAIEAFRGAAKAYPKSGEAAFMLGIVLLEKEKYAEAEKQLARAVALTPKKAEAHLALAKARVFLNNEPGAAAEMEKYLELNPGDTAVMGPLAALYHSMGRGDKAEKLFERSALATPNSAKAWFNYGLMLSQNGKYAAALDAFKKVRAIDPGFDKLDFYAGLSAYNANDFAFAEQCFDRLISRGQGNPQIYGAIGTIAAKRREFEKAEKYFVKALADGRMDRTILTNLVVVLVELDKIDDAIARLEPAMKKWKDDPSLTYALTALYVQKEKVSEARALLAEYLKKHPNDVKAMRLQARLYEKSLVESDKALGIYRKLLKLDPADVDSRKSLANMLRRGEKEESKIEALSEMKILLKYAPKDAEVWQDLGSLLEALGRKDEAVEHYTKMSSALPDIGLPLVRLGIMAEESGDKERARGLFDRALAKKEIGDLGVFVRLAKMYEDEGNAPGAELLYKRGLESLLEHSTKVFEEIMGGAGQGGGQLDLNKLLEIGEREKDLEKNTDTAIDGVSRAYMARDDRAGLMQYFVSVQEQYPRNKKLLRQMAKMEREDGNADRVLLLSNTLLTIDARDVDAHMYMAWAYGEKGDGREASLAWRRAAEADPRNQDALNGFVDSYAAQGRLPEVISWLERKMEKQAGAKQLTEALDRAKALEKK